MSLLDFFLGAYEGRDAALIVLEFLAFGFGVWSVWLAKKANIWVYPVGIIGTTITMYLFYVDRLLGDMMMNAYYSLMSLYGWWEWSRKREDRHLRVIRHMDARERMITLWLVLGTMVVTYSVYRVTGTPLDTSNYVDIFTSGLFFAAMWLMARKRIENWTLWIVADLITIPLYAYRGWGMLSLQYLIFTVLALQGYHSWKNMLQKSPSP